MLKSVPRDSGVPADEAIGAVATRDLKMIVQNQAKYENDVECSENYTKLGPMIDVSRCSLVEWRRSGAA